MKIKIIKRAKQKKRALDKETFFVVVVNMLRCIVLSRKEENKRAPPTEEYIRVKGDDSAERWNKQLNMVHQMNLVYCSKVSLLCYPHGP